MNSTDLALMLVVAVICGSIAQFTSGYSRGGWIVNVGTGFLGAVAGVVAARLFHAPRIYDLAVRTTDFPVMYAIVGCVAFLAAIGLFVNPGRH